MDFSEYQHRAARTYPIYKTSEEKLLNGVLGLTGEAGEVADVLKKALFQGHQLKTDKILEEVGDVLWYCSLVADSIGYTLDDVACRNIEKLMNRYSKGFNKEDSINRKE